MDKLRRGSSLGRVCQDHAGQDAVVDGLDGLLLLLQVVGLDAVVAFDDLQDLTFLLFALGYSQQVRQLL